MRDPNGVFHNQASFLNRIWEGRDLTALNANGNFAWAMLAKNPNGGKNLVQIQDLSGSVVINNVTVLNKFWDATRLAASGDIDGNSLDELLGFARNVSNDSNRAIQVIDHSTGDSIDIAKP